MVDQTNKPLSSHPNQVLTAVRLGWLTVEVFGRLRRYKQSGHQLQERRGDAARRFDFSDRALSQEDGLLLAVDQLRRTLAKLNLSLPAPPLPPGNELNSLLMAELKLDSLQGQLDGWSTQVWLALSTEDEIVGRGFTYGGSLADTYWYTDVLGPDDFADLLRPQRLEYIAARFNSISGHLPAYVAHVLNYSLHKWRDRGQIERLEAASRKKALKRLESQAKVWHDLLFGSRTADSYLLTRDRRLITIAAFGATFILVLAAMILIWLAVLTLSSTGRAVAASMVGLPQELGQAQATFVQDLLNWQMWSTLLATLSSVVVLVAGLVTRLSGWVIRFHHRVKAWLKRHLIYRRTYRSW